MHSWHEDSALQILELSLVPDFVPTVYAIGLSARRITFADQQRRAINVVSALLGQKRIALGDSIAIVGAGIAGVTAASYCLQSGLAVSLFEAFSEPFAIQQGSGRWIHPNIYDWPYGDDWRESKTQLPCMNWAAGSASDIIRGLRKEWNEIQNAVVWFPRTRISGLAGQSREAIVRDGSGNEHGPFRCVLLAVGFGEEGTLPNVQLRPYWRDDDLHQRMRDGGRALVSGCGDGGLIDTTRILLQDYRHDWLAEVAEAASSFAGLVNSLTRIEQDPAAYPNGEKLTSAIRDVSVPPTVVRLVRDRLRPNMAVILNGHSGAPFTRGSCLLNRFVVAQLMNEGVVEYKGGLFEPSSVSLSDGKVSASVAGESLVVDQLVVRHGPAYPPLRAFEEIERKLAPSRAFLGAYTAGVDITRRPNWAKKAAGDSPVSGAASATTASGLPQEDKSRGALARRGNLRSLLTLPSGGTVVFILGAVLLIFSIARRDAKNRSGRPEGGAGTRSVSKNRAPTSNPADYVLLHEHEKKRREAAEAELDRLRNAAKSPAPKCMREFATAVKSLSIFLRPDNLVDSLNGMLFKLGGVDRPTDLTDNNLFFLKDELYMLIPFLEMPLMSVDAQRQVIRRAGMRMQQTIDLLASLRGGLYSYPRSQRLKVEERHKRAEQDIEKLHNIIEEMVTGWESACRHCKDEGLAVCEGYLRRPPPLVIQKQVPRPE